MPHLNALKNTTPIESLDDIKDIELNILLKFKEICDKYALSYSLAYGTLLGAVRHKGFIPWDDDIDVMMPRPDYKRFIQLCKTELRDGNIKIASMHSDNEYFSPLTKVYDKRTVVLQKYGQSEGQPVGVYIDIFVVDGFPESGKEEFYNRAQKYRADWGKSVRKVFSRHRSRNLFFDIGGTILSLPYKTKGFKYYRNKYDEYCAQYSYKNAKTVGVIVYGEGLLREFMKKEQLTEHSEVEFEGHTFFAPKQPELYLANMYGEYMKLPPLEERISKHPHDIFRINV